MNKAAEVLEIPFRMRSGLVRGMQLLLIVLGFAYSSCKEPELVGIEVLPDDGYGVAWVDSFTVELSTVTDDSVITSNTSSSIYLLGDMNDPELGRTRAEFYTQFRLPSASLTFLAGSVVDSIVLNIVYAGAYGDVSKFGGAQRFGVYPLEDVIYDTTTYYSNVTRAYGTAPLAQVQVRPNLISDFLIGTDTIPLPPSLRIRLDNSFGQQLLEADPLVTLQTDTSFNKVFKGLAVVPENGSLASGQGGILYLNLASGYTRVELYYTDTSAKKQFFPINPLSAAHTSITHEHPLAVTSILGNTAAGADRAYLQSMAGLKMRVQFPTLRDLKQLGTVAINRAELVFPLELGGDFSKYGPPLTINAKEVDSIGRSLFIVDDFEIEGHLGGEYRPAYQDYVINVARHVQDVLNRPSTEPYRGLFIFNSGSAVNARRGIFNGIGHPDRPVKLRLTYTVIE